MAHGLYADDGTTLNDIGFGFWLAINTEVRHIHIYLQHQIPSL